MYERRGEPLLPRGRFLRRLALHVGASLGLTVASMAVGSVGYMVFERSSWDQAWMNTALMIGGLGPVDPPRTVGGRLFLGLYGAYLGGVFIVAMGIILTPILHRLLHRFHLDDDVGG